ncbi:Vsp/OspC family lipoprotein [Borrelia crocidurae]
MMMMVMMVMGCNSGGGIKEGEEGKARKGDGSVIDLKVIGEKIKSAVEFAGKVKEVETLVKSVGELAKAIGKKIKNGGGLDDNAGQNGSLLAGVHSLISAINTKLVMLEKTDGISAELKLKITAVKTDNTAFINKLESAHSDLGKTDATDAHAKSAIDITDNTKDKGATELAKLNVIIDELLKASNKIVSDAVSELVIKPTT